MQGSVQSDWTYAVTYLRTLYNDEELGAASGFFWRAGERTFLVTNWHVLACRDPETQQPRHSSGAIPNRLTMLVYKRTSEAADPDGYFTLQVLGSTFPLLGPGDPPRAMWLEHPTRRRAVDIAAIDVTAVLRSDTFHFKTVNELETDAQVDPRAGDDAFVIGYPLGILGGSPVPVWKRATIATEPFIDPGNLPRVFVDTATREGMSGSVVLAKQIVLGPYRKRDGSEHASLISFITKILGVYSGRLGPHEVQAQIGVVWKHHLIDEVIAGKCCGQTELE
jgi:hypothetical protein